MCLLFQDRQINPFCCKKSYVNVRDQCYLQVTIFVTLCRDPKRVIEIDPRNLYSYRFQCKKILFMI